MTDRYLANFEKFLQTDVLDRDHLRNKAFLEVVYVHQMLNSILDVFLQTEFVSEKEIERAWENMYFVVFHSGGNCLYERILKAQDDLRLEPLVQMRKPETSKEKVIWLCLLVNTLLYFKGDFTREIANHELALQLKEQDDRTKQETTQVSQPSFFGRVWIWLRKWM